MRSSLPSWFRSTCLHVRTCTFWPFTFTVWKNFQTSGFLSRLVSAVTISLPLSLHLLRSICGALGMLESPPTAISPAWGVPPHAVSVAAEDRRRRAAARWRSANRGSKDVKRSRRMVQYGRAIAPLQQVRSRERRRVTEGGCEDLDHRCMAMYRHEDGAQQ